MTTITIPYKPRYPELHEALNKYRFSVIVAHRRFGKTVLCINQLIQWAVLCSKPMGHLAYIAPYRNQAKAVAWAYLKHYCGKIPKTINETELSVELPSINGKAKIRLFGADNPDALRGLYFDAVVLDEVAQMRPEIWQDVVRPALADRQGKAVFIGTPNGPNLFRELYNQAVLDDNWLARKYPVTETEVLPENEVKNIQEELGEESFAREFLCDFEVASKQALFALSWMYKVMRRNYQEHVFRDSPVIMGVDVARYGDDSSVVTVRQGLFVEPQIGFKGLSLTDLCGRIVNLNSEKKPHVIFVDAIGVGAGVVDRLRELGLPVVDAMASARAIKGDKFVNRRAEMYFELKEWLENGQLPFSHRLAEELAAQEYEIDSSGKIKLMPKSEIKAKLRRSPDYADSLALTFFSAAPVATDGYWAEKKESLYADTTYHPFE